jgi:hypothetical protein
MVEFMGWFVQHPGRILALAAIYLAAWGVVRVWSAGRRSNALLLPAIFCLAFASWEWLVLKRTPGANIRADLLIIWPILLILTAWSLWLVLRRQTGGPDPR